MSAKISQAVADLFHSWANLEKSMYLDGRRGVRSYSEVLSDIKERAREVGAVWTQRDEDELQEQLEIEAD